VFQWPGGVFTEALELSYENSTAASFELLIETNDLSDAAVRVGSAQVAVDLLAVTYRYLFFGFEDPVPAAPASDAKFDSFVFEGPPPSLPPLPELDVPDFDPTTGEAALSWPSVAGQLYMLQGSSNLVAWEVIDGSDVNPFFGDGSPIEFVDQPGGERYFYRLTRP